MINLPMSAERQSREYDVVIVGGGHNGLVAGCYLARAGLRVLVVEKNDEPGGMTTTLPLVQSAPRHLISPCAYENVYLRAGGVVEDLGLRGHGYREHDSAGWAWLGEDGASICFQRDVDTTAGEIARFSTADARRYRELVPIALRLMALQDAYAARHPARPGWRLILAAVRRLAVDRELRRAFAGMITGTAADVIASTFKSEEVRGAFASIATILGSPTTEGSGIAILGTATLHHKGAGRPVGGMGGLMTALECCLRAGGGELRTGAPVTHIHTRGGRAVGVELAGGELIPASIGVVTAIPPQRIPELVGEALDGDVAGRLRAAPANAAGVATLTVNLALSGQVELPHHARPDLDLRRPALFTGTLDSVLTACEQSAAGEIPTRLPWWAAIFTAVDPTQAPPGQDVMQAYGPVPVHARGGWDAQREPAADRLLRQVGSAITDVAGLEIGRYVETPEDLSARTGTDNGCLYHVDHLPTRLGPLRPALGAGRYRTPLNGLYLTGAGTHPSGGVSGLPGKHAAAAVLRDLAADGGRPIPSATDS